VETIEQQTRLSIAAWLQVKVRGHGLWPIGCTLALPVTQNRRCSMRLVALSKCYMPLPAFFVVQFFPFDIFGMSAGVRRNCFHSTDSEDENQVRWTVEHSVRQRNCSRKTQAVSTASLSVLLLLFPAQYRAITGIIAPFLHFFHIKLNKPTTFCSVISQI